MRCAWLCTPGFFTHFNPDADSVGAVAWDSAAATTIPNSSPTYTYPSANYRMANGATGSAERAK